MRKNVQDEFTLQMFDNDLKINTTPLREVNFFLREFTTFERYFKS